MNHTVAQEKKAARERNTPPQIHVPDHRQPWKAFQARQRSMNLKRDAVLATAAHLFLEHGYRKSSMGLIAKQLKITKPALYHYFRNKEEILVECYRYGIAYIERLLDQTSANCGTGLRKLSLYVEAWAAAVVQHDFGRCVAMLDDSELSPPARREVRALKRRMDETLRSYVEEGIADGSIGHCNPKLVSFAIAGAINWIGTWYRPEGELQADEIANEFARMFANSVAASANRA